MIERNLTGNYQYLSTVKHHDAKRGGLYGTLSFPGWTNGGRCGGRDRCKWGGNCGRLIWVNLFSPGLRADQRCLTVGVSSQIWRVKGPGSSVTR